jgi:hypothetical protein
MKTLKRISTRSRIVIITVLTTVIYLALLNTSLTDVLKLPVPKLNFDPVKYLLLALVVYLGTYWVVYFKVKGERFLTVLLFPAISVVAISFLTDLIVAQLLLPSLGEFGQISFGIFSMLIFGIFLYIILLTVNILNAASLTDIPLGQAARAAMFLLVLVVAYIAFFLLYSNDISIFVRFPLLSFFGGFLLYISLWTIKMPIGQRIIAGTAVGLLLGTIGLILSVWPIASAYIALVLSLFFYICLNIAMEIRETLSQFIWLEFIILFGLIMMLLIILSEWGINGGLYL